MRQLPKLVFFGNERLVSGLLGTNAPVLNGLLDRGYNIAAVVSHHTEAKSRKPRPLEVATIAKKHGIPLFTPDRPAEIIDKLKSFRPDAAVLVAYGRIIPKSVIEIFPEGIINLHPSLLPKYRGPTPIETAILNGDNQTGVSIMQLTSGMDEGPIFAQKTCSIDAGQTKFDLHNKLASLGADLLLQTLPDILSHKISPVPQGNTGASYTQLLKKSDGILDTKKYTALELERQIRAFAGFPKSRLTIFDTSIIVTRAQTVAAADDLKLILPCKEGSYLEILELIAPSGKAMASEAFLRGYKKN